MYIAEEAFGVLFEKAGFAQAGWWNITSLALSATQGVDPVDPVKSKTTSRQNLSLHSSFLFVTPMFL